MLALHDGKSLTQEKNKIIQSLEQSDEMSVPVGISPPTAGEKKVLSGVPVILKQQEEMAVIVYNPDTVSTIGLMEDFLRDVKRKAEKNGILTAACEGRPISFTAKDGAVTGFDTLLSDDSHKDDIQEIKKKNPDEWTLVMGDIPSSFNMESVKNFLNDRIATKKSNAEFHEKTLDKILTYGNIAPTVKKNLNLCFDHAVDAANATNISLENLNSQKIKTLYEEYFHTTTGSSEKTVLNKIGEYGHNFVPSTDFIPPYSSSAKQKIGVPLLRDEASQSNTAIVNAAAKTETFQVSANTITSLLNEHNIDIRTINKPQYDAFLDANSTRRIKTFENIIFHASKAGKTPPEFTEDMGLPHPYPIGNESFIEYLLLDNPSLYSARKQRQCLEEGITHLRDGETYPSLSLKRRIEIRRSKAPEMLKNALTLGEQYHLFNDTREQTTSLPKVQIAGFANSISTEYGDEETLNQNSPQAVQSMDNDPMDIDDKSKNDFLDLPPGRYMLKRSEEEMIISFQDTTHEVTVQPDDSSFKHNPLFLELSKQYGPLTFQRNAEGSNQSTILSSLRERIDIPLNALQASKDDLNKLVTERLTHERTFENVCKALKMPESVSAQLRKGGGYRLLVEESPTDPRMASYALTHAYDRAINPFISSNFINARAAGFTREAVPEEKAWGEGARRQMENIEYFNAPETPIKAYYSNRAHDLREIANTDVSSTQHLWENAQNKDEHAYAVNSPDTSKDPIACSEDNALDTTYSAQGSHLHKHKDEFIPPAEGNYNFPFVRVTEKMLKGIQALNKSSRG